MVMPAPPRPTPELALLAAADLAPDEEFASLAAQAARGGFDWPRFGALAFCHDMGPVAIARLAEVCPDAVPAAVAQPLRDSLRESSAAMLAQATEAARLLRRLASHGIRSIVLKGVALAHLLYAPHPERRRSCDIDVLIDRTELMQADRILRESGYERTWPEGDLPRLGIDMLLHLANVFTYVAPATGQSIELHHRISLNPHWLPASFDTLFDRSIEIDTAVGPVRGLDGPLHVSYLAWHALGHAGFRLKWFCDIVRALRRGGAANCIEYLGAEPCQTTPRPLQVVDRVIAALGQGPWPLEGFGPREAARIMADLEEAAPMQTRRSLATLREDLAHLRFQLELSAGGQAKSYFLLRTVSDPRDVFALGLSRRFTPLYGALGPFIAVSRLIRRPLRRPMP
jgi:hypothetical protein